MFNVLVFNSEIARNVIYKTVQSKKEAKNLVKELRQRGKKASFTTSRNTDVIVANVDPYLEFSDEGDE